MARLLPPTKSTSSDAMNNRYSISVPLEREVDQILSGRTLVKSYDGTSQYSQNSVSSCGIASFNAVKAILTIEAAGTVAGSDLIFQMLSKELVEVGNWVYAGALHVLNNYDYSTSRRYVPYGPRQPILRWMISSTSASSLAICDLWRHHTPRRTMSNSRCFCSKLFPSGLCMVLTDWLLGAWRRSPDPRVQQPL